MTALSRLLSTVTLCLGLAAPVAALDLSAMTETEKKAFGEAVRAYLIENPMVMVETFNKLEEMRMSEQATSDTDFLRANADQIYTNPKDWAGGNLEGDVTVVEFLDYRCGYCRRAFTEVEELVASDGKIRFVVKELPILGPNSVLMSQFAVAVRKIAGDEAYKKAHDLLITLQGPGDEASLAEVASELGLDMAAIRTEMQSPETQEILRVNQELASALEISGTPTFIVNGTLVRGYVPLDAMRQIVNEQRQAANTNK